MQAVVLWGNCYCPTRALLQTWRSQGAADNYEPPSEAINTIPRCLLRANESIGPQRRMVKIEDHIRNARYAGLSTVPCIGVDLDPLATSIVYNGSLHPSDPMIGSLAYIKLRLSFFLWSHFTFLWHIFSYRSSFITSLSQSIIQSKTQRHLESFTLI